MTELPETQQQILDLVRAKAINGDPMPSRAEIAEYLGCGLSTAWLPHLRELKALGLIDYVPGRFRSIRLVEMLDAERRIDAAAGRVVEHCRKNRGLIKLEFPQLMQLVDDLERELRRAD